MVRNDLFWCAYNLLTYTVISHVFQYLPSTVIHRDLGQQRPCCAPHYCQRLYEKITCQHRWAYIFGLLWWGGADDIAWLWPGFMSDYITCTGVKCHTRDGNCWGMHTTSWSKAQVCRRTQLLVFWDLAFPSNLDIKTILTAIFESVCEMFA
jgi:hypothetical protein